MFVEKIQQIGKMQMGGYNNYNNYKGGSSLNHPYNCLYYILKMSKYSPIIVMIGEYFQYLCVKFNGLNIDLIFTILCSFTRIAMAKYNESLSAVGTQFHPTLHIIWHDFF